MPLIGTAGHVDHGKSTLVRRLTGRDPDRLEEERRRGLTIDLGFAWTTLPGGVEASFVDVPGHERFSKNMLAGIEAIDLALFVVAADEGWKPQSEEHLAVLDLLEVTHGVVALTKTDLVDSDTRELAHLEVADQIAGTSLSGSEIIPVSAMSGSGIPELMSELGRLASTVSVRDIGRPRMWVDREFSASGAGTVVTGSLLDGTLAVGDPVTVYPDGVEARIRGIQSHEQPHETVGPGRRVALNLSGMEHSAIGRGAMIGLSGQWRPTGRFVASIATARYHGEFDQRGSYHIHVGSTSSPVDVIGIAGDVAVLQTKAKLPLTVGDRFVIRDTGRRLVVAGGRVLDPRPGPTRRALSTSRRVDPSADRDTIAGVLLDIRGKAPATDLTIDSGGGTPADGVEIAGLWLTDDLVTELSARAMTLVANTHESHPLREGLALAELAHRLAVPLAVAEHVVGASADLERLGPEVSIAGRRPQLSESMIKEEERVLQSLSNGPDVPTIPEMGVDPELIHLMVRRGSVVRVSPEFVMLPSQLAIIRGAVETLPDNFTISDFRERTGLSRKYALPILEWADAEGLTVRRGDTRSSR